MTPSRSRSALEYELTNNRAQATESTELLDLEAPIKSWDSREKGLLRDASRHAETNCRTEVVWFDS
jgi:hypothetical protein